MRYSSFFALLCRALFVITLLPVSPARAQPAPGAPAATPQRDASAKVRAQKHFERGVSAYKEGRYKDAIDAFLDAHREYPSPSLSFNTARAYERMGDNAGALRFYREYLRQLPGAEDRATVEQKVSELEKKLQERGVQQVTVLSNVEGATVKIDGRPVGVAPWTGEILPGTHQLELRFEGYRDASVDFELVAHRAMDVRLDLQPAPKMPVQAPTAAPPRAVTPAKDGTGHGVSPWTWTAFGVGAAALGGALVFELLRAGAENDVKNEPTQIARHDAYDRMQSRQKTARILAGVGGAAVVVGGVLLYFDLSSQGQSPQQKQVGLGCAPGSCAALVRGRF